MFSSVDPASLFLDLVIGAVGMALFVYGKKAERWPHLGAGLLLMVYPYFVDGALWMFLIGAGIIVGLAASLWMGY
jgi:hypothetical protein